MLLVRCTRFPRAAKFVLLTFLVLHVSWFLPGDLERSSSRYPKWSSREPPSSGFVRVGTTCSAVSCPAGHGVPGPIAAATYASATSVSSIAAAAFTGEITAVAVSTVASCGFIRARSCYETARAIKEYGGLI